MSDMPVSPMAPPPVASPPEWNPPAAIAPPAVFAAKLLDAVTQTLARPVAGGVALSGGRRRIFLSSSARAQGPWATEGDVVEGWTLVAVDANGAELRHDSAFCG